MFLLVVAKLLHISYANLVPDLSNNDIKSGSFVRRGRGSKHSRTKWSPHTHTQNGFTLLLRTAPLVYLLMQLGNATPALEPE